MWTINWAHKKTDAKKSEISKRKKYLIVTAAAFLIGGYDDRYVPASYLYRAGEDGCENCIRKSEFVL